MTTLFTVDVICPVCEREFASTLIGSTNNFGPRTTDLRQFSAGLDPLPYLVSTCPACGFSGGSSAFGSGSRPPRDGAVHPEVARKVREQIAPLMAGEQPDATQRYTWAAVIAEWRGDPALGVGWLYLNAAWCADDDGHLDRAGGLRRQAATYFTQALRGGHVPEAERPAYSYLIGELHRRAGDDEDAAAWFERAIAADDGDWSELARQQQSAPQDMLM
jgi:uncharacterized protein (DUF2225 family)